MSTPPPPWPNAADDLLVRFQEQGYGTYEEDLGRTLFRDYMPASPDVIGVVAHTGGSAPVYGFGPQNVQEEYRTLSIQFRGARKDVDGPKVVAERAFADLCGLELVRLRSGQLYRYLKPLQPPFKISVDELERWVWGFNVMAEVEP